MNGNVILVGNDYEMLLQLAIGLHGTPDTVTVAESARPLARALQLVTQRPKAMLVTLDGLENVVDVRALLSRSPETRFMFIVPQMPLRHPLTRVVVEHGGAILSRKDELVVVVATLVALLAKTPAARQSSGAA